MTLIQYGPREEGNRERIDAVVGSLLSLANEGISEERYDELGRSTFRIADGIQARLREAAEQTLSPDEREQAYQMVRSRLSDLMGGVGEIVASKVEAGIRDRGTGHVIAPETIPISAEKRRVELVNSALYGLTKSRRDQELADWLNRQWLDAHPEDAGGEAA